MKFMFLKKIYGLRFYELGEKFFGRIERHVYITKLEMS